MSTGRGRSARLAITAIGCFLAAQSLRWLLFQLDGFRAFYHAHPWQVSETIWKVLWVVVALLGVMVAHRVGIGAALGEVGLGRPIGRPLLAALLATLPMLLSFAWLLPVNASFAPLAVWMTAIVSPLSEEILFRGYLFRQLHERSGWPFWLAVLSNLIPFAYGHIHQASEGGLRDLVLVVLVIGSGAAVFSWLYRRWNYNLWFVVGLHGLMNLWWYLFAVDDTAIGGWQANVARTLTLALAVLVTLRCTRRSRPS